MITTQKRHLIVFMVLLVGLFVLTPRFFDPSGNGESDKQWVGAKILGDTGDFPEFSLGPFYSIYLRAFLYFDYPWSVRLEYIATHFFAHGAIYLMLLRFLSWPLALFLSCAWIPHMANLHPGALVLGIAFVCMYFRGPGWEYNQGYFPLTLLGGALCHPAFVPFLAGHFIAAVMQRIFSGNNVRSKPKQGYGFLIAKGFLVLVAVLAIVHPSKRWDDNHMYMDPTYSPVPLKNNLTEVFFIVGTWKEVLRTVPPPLLVLQDWYFTTPHIFKGAHTILEAVIRAPDVVGKNLLENIVSLSVFPRLFMTGQLTGFPTLISFIFFPLGLIGMRCFYEKDKKLLPEITAMMIGTFAVVCSLLLTWVGERYMMALLPVGLICLCFIGRGAGILLSAREYFSSKSIRNKPVFFMGIITIGLILFFNPLILKLIFHHLGHDLMALSVEFDILLFISGAYFMVDSMVPRTVVLHDGPSQKLTALVIFMSACTVLLTASFEDAVRFPQGIKDQVKAVIKNEGLFDGVRNRSYRQLLKGLHKDSKVFADDVLWVKAFWPVDINDIYDPYDLPPYADKTGKVTALLKSMDAIWITSMANAQPGISTQIYLRYRLHLEPFLKDAVEQHHWTKEELPGYGTIYRKGQGQI